MQTEIYTQRMGLNKNFVLIWTRWTVNRCGNFFKGTVQGDFRPPHFHHSNRPEPLTNGLKIVSFSPRYSYFSGVQRSMILRGVKFRAVWLLRGVTQHNLRLKLRAVWYCTELDYAQYHTARSQVSRSLILRRAWLHAELDFTQYHTARSQQPHLQIFAQTFKGTVS